jgi:hypothetical protein
MISLLLQVEVSLFFYMETNMADREQITTYLERKNNRKVKVFKAFTGVNISDVLNQLIEDNLPPVEKMMEMSDEELKKEVLNEDEE